MPMRRALFPPLCRVLWPDETRTRFLARLGRPITRPATNSTRRKGTVRCAIYSRKSSEEDHPLAGGILVGMDGADERGARPSNNAPDELHLGRQNPDGSPDYHGWPDRYGGLPTSQAVYNPIGGGSDDDCNPPGPQCVPIRDVLAFPPQQITGPLANEGADSSFTGIDFVLGAFVLDPVRPGAVLYSLEGDFGFSPPNATAPHPVDGLPGRPSQWPTAGFDLRIGLPDFKHLTVPFGLRGKFQVGSGSSEFSPSCTASPRPSRQRGADQS
jgi:hypothetical protein